MKLTIVFLTASFLQVSATGVSQQVTFSGKKVALEKVFTIVEQQTGFVFLYTKDILVDAKPVSVDARNMPLEVFLKQVLEGQPLKFKLLEKTIIISRKTSVAGMVEPQSGLPVTDVFIAPVPIRGRVLGPERTPLAGASVAIRNAKQASTLTNAEGFFSLEVNEGDVLVFSFVGHETKEVTITSAHFRNFTTFSVMLNRSNSPLDEVSIVAYGQTTKRFSTGSVSTVKSEEIEKQPVSNPLAALQGRVPGMTITQTSGVPGSGFNIQVRSAAQIMGVNFLAPPRAVQPLFIIDGVPFTNDLTGGSAGGVGGAGFGLQVGTANSGQSPFASINPADIESIDVLKDADATAIYGSRGANGVVLITTKKGKAGATRGNIMAAIGTGKVNQFMDYLNTEQYLAMRKEAFFNDNKALTISSAPDLLAWDSTRYIDWQQLLIGNTANYTDINANISGGSSSTQFLLGVGYHKESTVFPGDFADVRNSVHVNINHSGSGKKFQVSFSSILNHDKNTLPANDVVTNITLPPNAPAPFDSIGNLNWSEKGAVFNNPFRWLTNTSVATTINMVNNLTLSYEILPGLRIKSAFGATLINLDEKRLDPISSQNPANNPTGLATFITSNYKTWLAEPQIDYNIRVGGGRLQALIGSTFQHNEMKQNAINATGYTNDALIGFAGAAPALEAVNYLTIYRYNGVFGSLKYNLHNKYLLNLSGRRDGSSRFGPGRRFGNFGAIGAGWIFSEERFFKKLLPVISYAKLRGSFGSTGGDNVGDYQYFDTYGTSTYPYQGVPGLIPGSLFNPVFGWEKNNKLDLALELGLLKDRLFINANFYRNRTSNQLINYTLPNQTGFPSILTNFNALVQNTGWEVDLQSLNIKTKRFRWNSSVNISIPRSKLVDYPGLASSSNASRLKIGYPLEIRSVYHVLGVDPATGIYQFSTELDKIVDLTPRFYGGFSNNIQVNNIEISFFFQFRKQIGFNYLSAGGTTTPGGLVNQPLEVLARWQKPGDQTNIQKFTTANTVFNTYKVNSEARYTDASFIRLKNVSVSYSLPEKLLKKIQFDKFKLFFQAQNLLTITSYRGLDPETNTSGTIQLPSLQVMTWGIQASF